MTPQDEQVIRQAPLLEANSPPTVILVPGNGDAGQGIIRFCDSFRGLVSNLKIKKESDLPFPGPSLVIGRYQNICYQAEPTGKILSCFMEALASACGAAPEIDPEMHTRIKAIHLPVILKMYVAGLCPHCPQRIRQLQLLAAHSPLIRLRIVDAESFPEAAQTDQVRSVPTLILDDQLRWTGAVNTEELLSLFAQRDPSRLSADSLRQIIEAGDAARLAEMMAAAGILFPALLELLVHERWSIRLGAMVTAEYLAEAVPALSLELCELLWERFARLSPQVQGDVVQVFGQNDADVTRSYLRSVVAGTFDEEVKTAAAEVLEEMEPK